MKQTAGWIAILAVLAICFEIIAFAVVSLVPQFQQFTYRTPEVTQKRYETYMAERDPLLGWPGKSFLEKRADDQGARISPVNDAFGPDAPACISVYGDSFAYSAEVEPKDAWANVLADRRGCRVNNFGVGGFGADQAVLRLERHLEEGQDVGDTLILTLYPDNLNRHMNQWRNLLTGQPLSFKPAFRVDETSEVVLEPIFDGDYETFLKLVEDPAAYLPAERYLPDAPGLSRMKRVGLPYSVAFTRLLLSQIQSFRGFDTDGRASFYNYPGFYDTPEGASDEKKAVATHISAGLRYFAKSITKPAHL